MKVPFVDLKSQYQSIKREIDRAIEQVISDTAFIGGKYVKKFTTDYAKAYGVKHVIPCANGTDALYIIMKMLGIGEGDEVITASNSWISSSETITQTGAKVVFADIDPIYYSIDEHQLTKLINSNTKAVIAVHLQGQMCAIDKIQKICKDYNIYLIEDCAQAHFSSMYGKYAGLWGIAGTFSFYPGKNLGAYGDAGCIITNDDALAEKCKMYANHGALKKPHHQMEGINSRMDGLQAAILSAKLPYLNKWIENRIQCAFWYNNYLGDLSKITLPTVRPDTRHTYHVYLILAKERDRLRSFLTSRGIETSLHYPVPLPFLPAYNYLNSREADFPVVSKMQHKILSLPMYPELTEDMIKYVSDSIREFYQI